MSNPARLRNHTRGGIGSRSDVFWSCLDNESWRADICFSCCLQHLRQNRTSVDSEFLQRRCANLLRDNFRCQQKHVWKNRQVQSSNIEFLRDSNPQDEFFLVTFNDHPELRVDFTASIQEIQNEISQTKPDGTTALLDTVYLGLDLMKNGRHERKALLIISDGGDNHSRYSAKEIWSTLLESGVQIYAMGIFVEAPRTKAERNGPDLLSAITGVTGGRTFAINSLKRIGEAATELSTELRNQYLIAYHPTNLIHDGKWHRISVRVTPSHTPPRLRVYAKAGYYAPAR
jgi:Ca-activated chloride channel homolog